MSLSPHAPDKSKLQLPGALVVSAEGKKGAKKADNIQAVLDRIAEMAPEDRALAERVHVTVTATAPELSPKTWYGMPPTRTRTARSSSTSRTRASSATGTRPSASRTRRTSMTATCGRCRTRSRNARGGEEGRRAGEGDHLLSVAATRPPPSPTSKDCWTLPAPAEPGQAAEYPPRAERGCPDRPVFGNISDARPEDHLAALPLRCAR